MRAAAAPGAVTDLLPADQVLTGEEALAWSRGFPAEAAVFPAGPEEVRAEVFENLDAGVPLIGPECAIPLQTPLDNLRAIPAAVRAWHDQHPNGNGNGRGPQDG